MKNIPLIMALVVLLPLLGWSQPKRTGERIEAFRIGFFTQRLQLTPEESQQFWPIFNEMEEKERNIRKTYMDDRRLELLSDAEAEQLIDNYFEMEEKLLQVKKEYYQKLRNVLPARKIALLPRIDRQFKERLLEEMRNRQQGGGR
jgi:hypothetical protein